MCLVGLVVGIHPYHNLDIHHRGQGEEGAIGRHGLRHQPLEAVICGWNPPGFWNSYLEPSIAHQLPLSFLYPFARLPGGSRVRGPPALIPWFW